MSHSIPAPRTGAGPGARGTLGRACHRHRWLTLLTWIVGLACLITLWIRFGAPSDNNFSGNDPGQTLLNQHFQRQSADALTLAIRSQAPVTSAQARDRITGALVPFSHAPHGTAGSNPYSVPGQSSRDWHRALAARQFALPSAAISSGAGHG